MFEMCPLSSSLWHFASCIGKKMDIVNNIFFSGASWTGWSFGPKENGHFRYLFKYLPILFMKNLEIKIIRTVSSERSFLKILESILSWAWIFIVTTKWDLCNLLNPIYWWLDIPALVIKGNQIIGMCVAHWYSTPGCSRSISGSNPGISQSTNLGRRADPPWAWGTKRVNKNNLPGDREQLPYTEATVLEISRLASVLPIAPPRQVAQCTIVAEEPFSFRLD